MTGLLAFDRDRLDILRRSLDAALADLDRIRSDDANAADAIRSVRAASRTIGESCLPRVHSVLNSKAMTWARRAGPACDAVSESAYALAHFKRWETAVDPLAQLGPPSPRCRSFDEVLSQIRAGVLVPMTSPLDAEGRALAHYTSLTFAPGAPVVLGQVDLRSNLDRLVDFFSDGLPIGMRHHETLTVYYLSNAQVVSNVHTLTAYDRDEGPETDWARGTEATVSGYMVIEDSSTVAEIGLHLGPEGSDPTASHPIVSQRASGYSGVFYPDAPPVFEPIQPQAQVGNPTRWTFTTSAGPMAEGWGTWGL